MAVLGFIPLYLFLLIVLYARTFEVHVCSITGGALVDLMVKRWHTDLADPGSSLRRRTSKS